METQISPWRHLLTADGQIAQTSTEVEETLKTLGYIVITGNDNARIPAEDVRSYVQFRDDHLSKLDDDEMPMPF